MSLKDKLFKKVFKHSNHTLHLSFKGIGAFIIIPPVAFVGNIEQVFFYFQF